MTEERVVGQTKTVGFQIGVRRTFALPLDAAWQLITSPAGVSAWLGDLGEQSLAEGVRYRAADGSHGEVRVFKERSHLRLTWQPGGWPRPSLIQVRTIAGGDHKTVIAFHQEHLPDATAREARRTHFKAALDTLESLATS